MIDYHIHTDISADCKVPMRRMAQAARDAGIKEIGFSEHIDLGLLVPPDFTVDFAAYEAAFEQTRCEFPELNMRRGIEAGLDLRYKDEIVALLSSNPCDFVIGSIVYCLYISASETSSPCLSLFLNSSILTYGILSSFPHYLHSRFLRFFRCRLCFIVIYHVF